MLRWNATGLVLAVAVLTAYAHVGDNGHETSAQLFAAALLLVLIFSPLFISTLLIWRKLTHSRWRQLESSLPFRAAALALISAALPLAYYAVVLLLDATFGWTSAPANARQLYAPWAAVAAAWLVLPRLLDPALRRPLHELQAGAPAGLTSTATHPSAP